MFGERLGLEKARKLLATFSRERLESFSANTELKNTELQTLTPGTEVVAKRAASVLFYALLIEPNRLGLFDSNMIFAE